MARDIPMIPLDFQTYSEEEIQVRARNFYQLMDKRRTVRFFSDRPIPDGVLEDVIRTASTAPSGAHKQPWYFAVITDPKMKTRVREAAEKEERENYERRMSQAWLEDLAPFRTNEVKPYIEIAPAIIVVFKQAYSLDEAGNRQKNYYVNESVGIAAGMLIAAIHNAGLVTLTHTPSPMGFLGDILGRPKQESAILLLPVGFPADDCVVPKLERKSLEEIMGRY